MICNTKIRGAEVATKKYHLFVSGMWTRKIFNRVRVQNVFNRVRVGSKKLGFPYISRSYLNCLSKFCSFAREKNQNS